MPDRLTPIDHSDPTTITVSVARVFASCGNATTRAAGSWRCAHQRGVVCAWPNDAISIANPGDFRMPIEEARKPGSTDPRNETMMRMFSIVEIGERAGSGMDKIFGGWEWAGYPAPTYEVAYGPDRTTLMLPLVSADSTSDGRQKSAVIGRNGDGSAKSAILAYLSQFGPTKRSELEKVTGLGTSRVNDLLRELTADGSIVAEGATRSRKYRLAE